MLMDQCEIKVGWLSPFHHRSNEKEKDDSRYAQINHHRGFSVGIDFDVSDPTERQSYHENKVGDNCKVDKLTTKSSKNIPHIERLQGVYFVRC